MLIRGDAPLVVLGGIAYACTLPTGGPSRLHDPFDLVSVGDLRVEIDEARETTDTCVWIHLGLLARQGLPGRRKERPTLRKTFLSEKERALVLPQLLRSVSSPSGPRRTIDNAASTIASSTPPSMRIRNRQRTRP